MVEVRTINLLRGRRLLRRSSVWHPVDLCGKTQEGDDYDDVDDKKMIGNTTGMFLFQINETRKTQTAPAEMAFFGISKSCHLNRIGRMRKTECEVGIKRERE